MLDHRTWVQGYHSTSVVVCDLLSRTAVCISPSHTIGSSHHELKARTLKEEIIIERVFESHQKTLLNRER